MANDTKTPPTAAAPPAPAPKRIKPPTPSKAGSATHIAFGLYKGTDGGHYVERIAYRRAHPEDQAQGEAIAQVLSTMGPFRKMDSFEKLKILVVREYRLGKPDKYIQRFGPDGMYAVGEEE